MSKTALAAAMTVFCLFSCAGQLLAQVARPVRPVPVGRPQVEPCWQQAGLSKGAMEERAAIGRETRSQVEAVCADTSLTPQQRQQRIREIRQQAKERMDALVSPQQQEALSACQKERAASHPAAAPAVHHGGGTGPCGELLPQAGHPSAPDRQTGNNKPPTEEDTSPQH